MKSSPFDFRSSKPSTNDKAELQKRVTVKVLQICSWGGLKLTRVEPGQLTDCTGHLCLSNDELAMKGNLLHH